MAQHKLADILRAIAEGKDIQWRSKDWKRYCGNDSWNPCDYTHEVKLFELNEYRIKPDTKKYRVAEYKNTHGMETFLTVCHDTKYGAEYEKAFGFVRWVSDWIEYE